MGYQVIVTAAAFIDLMVAAVLLFKLHSTGCIIPKMKAWQILLLYIGLPILVLVLAIAVVPSGNIGLAFYCTIVLLCLNVLFQMFSSRSVLEVEHRRKEDNKLRSKAMAFESQRFEP